MKTSKLFLALFMLAVTMSADAQDHVLKAFEKIEELTSIHQSFSTNEERDSTGRIISSSYYKSFKTGSIKEGLSNLLQEAFEKDKDNAQTAFINTSSEVPRYHYMIVQKGGRTITIGKKKDSSYFILTFPDNEHQGYRHAYAAEWWNASDSQDPNILEGYTVVVYGEKPTTKGISSFNMDNIFELDTTKFHPLPGTDWTEKIESYKDLYQRYKGQSIPDMSKLKVFKGNSFYWDAQSGQWKSLSKEGMLPGLPVTGNKDEWLDGAMDNIENLNNRDWHRLFGIITQKMSEGDYSEEDLVVASGIVLTLCKNAADLDKDEKEVCVSRLRSIAKKFSDPYIKDMLLLSAKKLEKS